jgi:hypothetical protein
VLNGARVGDIFVPWDVHDGYLEVINYEYSKRGLLSDSVEITKIGNTFDDKGMISFKRLKPRPFFGNESLLNEQDFMYQYQPATIEQVMILRATYPVSRKRLKQKQLLEEKMNALQNVWRVLSAS